MLKKAKYVIVFAFVLLTMSISSVVYAETIIPSLSIEQAIEMAVMNSPDVRKGKLQLDIYERLKEDAQSAVTYTPTDYMFETPGTANPYAIYLQAKYSYDKQDKEIANNIKKTAINTLSAYYSILKSEQGVKAAELALKKAQLQLTYGNAKHRVGLINSLDLLGLQAGVESARSALEEANKQLELKWAEFNKIIGRDYSYRAQLTDKITYQPTNFDVEEKVGAALTNSFEIWNAEKAAQLARDLKIFEQYYNTGERKEKIAEISYKDAEEQLRIQTRDLCMAIKALEVKHNYLVQKVSELQEALRIAQLQNKLGLVTADVPINLESNLIQVNNSLLGVDSQHQIAVKNLERLTGEYQVFTNK